MTSSNAYVVTKTPAEIEDWTIDWSTRGLGTDIIASSTWAVNDSALVITTPASTFTNITTTVWLSAGIAGNPYLVTNTIGTSGGRTLQETFLVDCIPQRLIGT